MENNILNSENSENLNQENSSFFDEKVSSSNSNEEQPKLRFKNQNGHYYENWEIACFGNFIQEISQLTSDTEQYPLYSLTLESGVTPKSSRYEREFLITKEGDSYKIVPPQAFVYNPMNLRFGALAANHNDFKVSVSGYYDVFYMGNKNTLTFWENYLTTPKMLHYYFTIATGSLIEKLRVHFTQFVKIEKKVPCIDEQQKIADFLSLVDKRIDKQRQLVENLKKYKRGLFVQLYNQSTKNKIQIKNLGEYFSAGILSKEDIVENGSNPCILYGELFTKYNEVIQEVYSSTNKNILSKTIGTEILFPSSTTVDALSLICPSSIKQKDIILGGDLFAIKLKKDFDNDFMSYLFNYIYKRLLAKFAQGITIVHLHYSDIKEQFIEVPSIQEQIKIIKIINNIENYILKNEKIYEQLKFIKQGLLQQMFI